MRANRYRTHEREQIASMQEQYFASNNDGIRHGDKILRMVLLLVGSS